MSQQLIRLIPQLKVPVQPVYRRFSNPEGSLGRLKRIRAMVNDLVRDERIQANFYTLDEARPYAERLISDAVRLGDKDEHTMEMANFWLPQKQLIYKLFQVLAPRYSQAHGSYTRLFALPKVYEECDRASGQRRVAYKDAVLELKGNPFPPLVGDNFHENPRRLLHNVLLDGARREHDLKKMQSTAPAPDAVSEAAVGENDDSSATPPEPSSSQ